VFVALCQNRVVHVRMVAFDFFLHVSCSSRSYVVFPCLMALTSAKRRYVVHLSALVMLYENVSGVAGSATGFLFDRCTDLRETICCTQNWAHVEDFAQLCYNPVPSLVSLCPDACDCRRFLCPDACDCRRFLETYTLFIASHTHIQRAASLS
jgi:hypothetical protein